MLSSIEFIGLPGAGKTTIANALRKELEARGFRVYSARELFRMKACEELGLGWPQRFQFRVENLSRNRLQGLTKALRKKLFTDFAKNNREYVELCHKLIRDLPYQESVLRRWLEEEGAGWSLFEKMDDQKMIYLNDEGFLHRALSYTSTCLLCPHWTKQYFELCPKHANIFIVKTPVEVILGRIGNISRTAFSRRGITCNDAKKNLLEQYEHVVDEMLCCLDNNILACLDGKQNVLNNLKHIKRIYQYI